uniref:Uncharacterized protein n=1 Tax=Curvibacter symbiont subsp. Hydra magnipapillata TaxID=667019 RepID=C9Y971_CURXX|nr:hypothetical protein Csp_A06720 [Curvibacter putative symbiont of Hydra magnipapillata]
MGHTIEYLHKELLNLSIHLEAYEGDPSPELWDQLSRNFAAMRDAITLRSEN